MFFNCKKEKRFDVDILSNTFDSQCILTDWIQSVYCTQSRSTVTSLSCRPRFQSCLASTCSTAYEGCRIPLCLETVKNPKTLPCLHSFCLECLDELANVARTQLQTTINCLPFARLPFQFPTQIPSPIGLHCFISTN